MSLERHRTKSPLRAVLALALIGAQGGLAAHFVLVKHEFNPETGEVVHADPSAQKHIGHRPLASEAILVAASDEERDPPEHCAIVGLRRDVAMTPQGSVTLSADAGAIAIAPPAAWALPATPSLRVAPKQSPPA